MTLKEKILKAVDTEDWYSVMQLASEARKLSVADEEYFGIKKEYISIFYCDNVEKFTPMLKLAGFKVFRGNYNNILKRVNKGEIIQNDRNNRIAIITNSDSLKARLEAIGFLCPMFIATTLGLYSLGNDLPYPNEYDRENKFVIKNFETNKEYRFDENIAKAINREEQINKIIYEA